MARETETEGAVFEEKSKAWSASGSADLERGGTQSRGVDKGGLSELWRERERDESEGERGGVAQGEVATMDRGEEEKARSWAR